MKLLLKEGPKMFEMKILKQYIISELDKFYNIKDY